MWKLACMKTLTINREKTVSNSNRTGVKSYSWIHHVNSAVLFSRSADSHIWYFCVGSVSRTKGIMMHVVCRAVAILEFLCNVNNVAFHGNGTSSQIVIWIIWMRDMRGLIRADNVKHIYFFKKGSSSQSAINGIWI